MLDEDQAVELTCRYCQESGDYAKLESENEQIKEAIKDFCNNWCRFRGLDRKPSRYCWPDQCPISKVTNLDILAKCPNDGLPMYREKRPLTLTYKGKSITFDMPGWYCHKCGEGIHSGSDMQISDQMLNKLKSEQ